MLFHINSINHYNINKLILMESRLHKSYMKIILLEWSPQLNDITQKFVFVYCCGLILA